MSPPRRRRSFAGPRHRRRGADGRRSRRRGCPTPGGRSNRAGPGRSKGPAPWRARPPGRCPGRRSRGPGCGQPGPSGTESASAAWPTGRRRAWRATRPDGGREDSLAEPRFPPAATARRPSAWIASRRNSRACLRAFLLVAEHLGLLPSEFASATWAGSAPLGLNQEEPRMGGIIFSELPGHFPGSPPEGLAIFRRRIEGPLDQRRWTAPRQDRPGAFPRALPLRGARCSSFPPVRTTAASASRPGTGRLANPRPQSLRQTGLPQAKRPRRRWSDSQLVSCGQFTLPPWRRTAPVGARSDGKDRRRRSRSPSARRHRCRGSPANRPGRRRPPRALRPRLPAGRTGGS